MSTLLERRQTYALRGICMLMIVAGHVSSSVTGDDALRSWLTQWCGLAYWGEWGTGVFFFLSGYGLSLSLEAHHPIRWGYVRQKVVRLFEPYLFFWVFYLLVLLVCDRQQIGYGMIVDFLTLGMPLGVDAWFFKIIVAVYVVMMLLHLFPMGRLARLLLMTLAVSVYYVVMRHLQFGPWWFNTILNFPLGMFFALYYDQIARHCHLILVAILFLAIATYFLDFGFLGNLCFTLVCVYLIRFVPVSWPPLVFIGTNGLFFYFLEEPAYHYLLRALSSNFPLYAASTIVLVYLVTLLYMTIRKRCCR